MEERKLNEKESLELIAQMIQNTKNRLETNCGMPFLFWGYTTLFVSLLIWFLVVTTRNYYWQYLWFLLPIIAGTGTYLSTRNQQPGIKTHLDKVINYIWLVFGITGFLISMLAMFFWQLPILFIILLLMGMGTTLTGLVVGYKTVTYGKPPADSNPGNNTGPVRCGHTCVSQNSPYIPYFLFTSIKVRKTDEKKECFSNNNQLESTVINYNPPESTFRNPHIVSL